MAATAIIGGVATLGGAFIGANAAQQAANTESNAANAATATQQSMFNTEQQNAQPWMQAGKSALTTLQGDLPQLTSQFTMQDFYNNQDPAYQFDLQQGEQAMQRSAAAKGILNSQGTLQNLNNYAQGMASNEYGNAYNRFVQNQQQTYNMLSGISNQGLQATGMANSAAQNAANNISSNQIAAGNAQAAGQVGTANAITGGLSSVANGALTMSLLNKLNSGGSGISTNPAAYGGLNGSSQLTMPQVGQSFSMPQATSTYNLLDQ